METTPAYKKNEFFTSMDYYSKRDASLILCEAFRKANWKIYGFKEDTSDSMTDYYNPASWDGIATKENFIICIDVSDYQVKNYSGRPITESKETRKGCTNCNATGKDPDGWTLQSARLNPINYNLSKLLRQYPGSTVNDSNEIVTSTVDIVRTMVSNLVSPIRPLTIQAAAATPEPQTINPKVQRSILRTRNRL